VSFQNDFLQNFPCIGFVLDARGTIRMASAYGCQRLGYSSTADLVGKPIFTLVAASDRDRFATTLPSEPTDPVQGEAEFPVVVGDICVRVLPSDGSTIWVKTRCRWVSDRDRSSQIMLVWEEIDTCQANPGQKCKVIQEIADTLPVCLSYVDTQQRYIYVNQTYERWFGLSREEIYGRHVHEILGEAAYEQARPYVERVLAGEEVIYQCQIPYPVCGERYVRGTLIPNWGENGNVQGYYALVEDITPQQQAQADLKQSQNLFQQIAETSPEIIYILQVPQGNCVYANRQMETILGYSPEEFFSLGVRSFLEKMHPDDRSLWQQSYSDRFAGVSDGEVVATDFRVKTAAGYTRWLRSREVVFQRNCQGEPQQILGIAQDITVHKLVEIQLEQLWESESRLHTILNNTSDGIVIVDQQRQIRFINPAAQKLFHFSLNDTLDWEFGLPDLHGDTVELQIPLATNDSQPDAVHNARIGEMKIAEAQWKGEPVYVLSLRDITKRRHAEAALAESEERFRQLAEHIEDVFWLFSWENGDFLYISPAFEQVWQRSRNSVYANPGLWEASIYPDDQWVWQNAWRKHQQGIGSSYESRIVRPNGEVRWISTRSFPILDDRGQVYRIAGVSEDISDRKQVEEQIRESQTKLILSEQRYRLVSELTSDYSYAIRLWDDGRLNFEWITDSFTRITGYLPNTFSHVNNWLFVIHPEDRDLLRQHLQTLRSGKSNVSEYRIFDNNGQLHWLRDYARPVLTANYYKNPFKQNVPLLIYGAAQDITDQKQAEESLQRLRSQNDLILRSAGEGICGFNVTGKMTFANPAAARMLACNVEDLMGLTMEDILVFNFLREQGTPGWEPFSTATQKQSACEVGVIEGIFRRRDGSQFPVDYVYNSIYEQGVPLGGVLTFKDITERKAIERMKNEFISVVSHELRTPLTSMRGALGLLSTGKLGELSSKGYHMVDIALRNTERLTRLINDILDVQRLESGRVRVKASSVAASDLLEQAADTMRGMAENAGITVEIEPTDQIWMEADFDLLLQVLTNLLSNAIKFSEAGDTVWLRSQPTHNDHADVDGFADAICFQVQDQGPGMTADKLESIFEPFQQVDASDSRQKGGTGLGLTICRQIITAHGGRIWAESALGEGSTFSFIIPMRSQS
jgi:PAS domain S-box-containing protein